MREQKFNVSGMSCAACSAHVEKAVCSVAGVSSAVVNLLSGSVMVSMSDDVSFQDIITAVEKAGYTASLPRAAASAAPAASTADSATAAAREEITLLKRRLIFSIVLLVPLMYLSMGHMFGAPLPQLLSNPASNALAQLLLAAVVMLVNQRFFVNGWRGLRHGAPNMDTLVALGSGASYVYSVAVLFLLVQAACLQDSALVQQYAHGFYFEAAAMIVTLITVGKLLEAVSKGHTTDALFALMQLQPQQAHIIKDGREQTVAVEQVQVGDIFVVRPAEKIPVDGIVSQGSSAVDESALSGESMAVDKTVGDKVSAGTLNQNGFLSCVATHVGQDTAISRIIALVENAAATKAPLARVADKVAAVFVPIVLCLAVITAVVWLLGGAQAGFALARAVSVLVISCPCAFGLATPVAIMVGSGVGARQGILFKNASALEQTGKCRIVVLDKTGTITKGQPAVSDIVPAAGISEQELLRLAAAVEVKSEHPLAHAVSRRAEELGLQLPQVDDFRAQSGHGVQAVLEGKLIKGGKAELLHEDDEQCALLRSHGEQLAEQGKTPLYFMLGERPLGLIAVADEVKEDSAAAIAQLQQMGLRVIMLTGDNERTARAVAAQVGIDSVIAGVLPEDKESVVRQLQLLGAVLMVGDGINDAPALTAAEVGMAIGAGTDVARDAASVVLMHSSLQDVCAALRLSRQVRRNIHQNIFWAFFYNCLGIPLAAGVFIPLLGWQLGPMFAAAAMSISSFCVVTNALRLNLFDLRSAKRDKKLAPIAQDELQRIALLQYRPQCCAQAGAADDTQSCCSSAPQADVQSPLCCTLADTASLAKDSCHAAEAKSSLLLVTDMMCGHCRSRIEQALYALPAVITVAVDLETRLVKVEHSAQIEAEQLLAAVRSAGYAPSLQ